MSNSFEDCTQSVTITRLHLARIEKSGHCTDRDEFAFLNLAIGECHVAAELLRDGSLRLPRGVRIPAYLRKRAKEEARQMAIAELIETWSEQRDPGEMTR